MTKQQREDAEWWRRLARDYERRTARVSALAFNGRTCIPICGIFDPADWYPKGARLRPDAKRRFQQMQEFGRVGYSEWWPNVGPDDPEAFDLRATACCLIAAMVEAGDA